MRKNPLTSETYVLHMFGVFLTLVSLYRSRQNLAHILWMKHRTLLLKVGDFFGILRHAILCTTETYLWKTLDKKTRGRNCSKGFSAFVYLSDFSFCCCYFCMTETTNESRTNHNIKCVAKWGKFLGFSALYHQHIGHLMLPLNSVFVLFTKPTH